MNLTNAAVAWRCSASIAPAAIGPRSDGRQERRQVGVLVGLVRERRQLGVHRVAPEQEGAVPLRRDQPLERRRRACRDEDLARFGRVLEPERRRGGRPADDQLAVVAADEEEVAGARDEPGRHPEAHGPDARFAGGGLGDERLHRQRGARGALLVPLAVEEQQQRVAAELEHVAAVAPRRCRSGRSSSG